VIVLDASVLIAYLTPVDSNHQAAQSFLLSSAVDDGENLLVNPVTLAEALVWPAGNGRLDVVLAELTELGVTEAPFPPGTARTLAGLRVTSGLKLPDCIVLLTALEHRAVLASFDNRLRRTAALHGVEVQTYPTP